MSGETNGLFQAARLWEREGGNGPFLSGTLGGLRIVITRNRHLADENDSGWVLLVGPNDADRPRKPTSSERSEP